MKLVRIFGAVGRRFLRYIWYPAVSLFQDRKWRIDRIQPHRIGSVYGGGWVALDMLDASSTVYSFGIGCDISFDRELIERTGCSIAGFDPTPKSALWIRQQTNLPPGFTFYQFGLAESTGNRFLFLPENPDYVSGSIAKDLLGDKISCSFLSLSDTLKKLNHESIDLLKLDIEGAEYSVIKAWKEEGAALPFSQLWVEFHPRLAGSSTGKTANFVRSLSTIGLIPAKRAFLQDPNHFLLVNAKHLRVRQLVPEIVVPAA